MSVSREEKHNEDSSRWAQVDNCASKKIAREAKYCALASLGRKFHMNRASAVLVHTLFVIQYQYLSPPARRPVAAGRACQIRHRQTFQPDFLYFWKGLLMKVYLCHCTRFEPSAAESDRHRAVQAETNPGRSPKGMVATQVSNDPCSQPSISIRIYCRITPAWVRYHLG